MGFFVYIQRVIPYLTALALSVLPKITLTYTIVMTMKSSDGGTWGKLKSGVGWINIGAKYCKRVN